MAGQIIACLALVAAVAGTGFVHRQIPPTTDAERGEAFVPDPALAKLMSLGFDAALADYYWLVAIQAVGSEEIITPEVGNHLGKLVDVVTTLDPWVDHPYRFAAVWLVESEENVLTANRLLRRGIEHHPEEWRNRFYLGFNLFYYMNEFDAAAEELEIASQLPGSPPYLPRLVARLRSHTADIDVAEAFLSELVRGSGDEVARNGYLAALDEIEVERKAQFLDRARDAFNQLNGRDIMNVEELVTGSHPILKGFPSPEPDALPPGLSRGSVWKLDLESDEIISTYYGTRYQLHFAGWQREKVENWRNEERPRRARGGDRNDEIAEPADPEEGEGAPDGA